MLIRTAKPKTLQEERKHAPVAPSSMRNVTCNHPGKNPKPRSEKPESRPLATGGRCLGGTMEHNAGVFLVGDAPALRRLGELKSGWCTDYIAQTIGSCGGGEDNNRPPQPIVVHGRSEHTRSPSAAFVLEYNGRGVATDTARRPPGARQ
jgi:hypothetical protein